MTGQVMVFILSFSVQGAAGESYLFPQWWEAYSRCQWWHTHVVLGGVPIKQVGEYPGHYICMLIPKFQGNYDRCAVISS